MSEDGLRVNAGNSPEPHLVASLRLAPATGGEFEPSAEDSISPKLRSAFEALAGTGCLPPQTLLAATRRVVENLPLRFNELLPHHYSYFRGGSSIDLSPGSRLKVQEAVFDEEARAAAIEGGSTGPLAGYVGTVTAYYEAQESGRGSVALELASIDSGVPADAPQNARGSIPAGLGALSSRYLRLVFLGWVVAGDAERKSVLLASEHSNELERMSSAVLENPAGLCAAAAPGADSKCFAFSGRTSTEVKVRIRVNGEDRYVLLGTLLKAVAPPQAGVDSRALAKLRLRRRYGGRLVAVDFSAAADAVLELPLLAGDEVEW